MQQRVTKYRIRLNRKPRRRLEALVRRRSPQHWMVARSHRSIVRRGQWDPRDSLRVVLPVCRLMQPVDGDFCRQMQPPDLQEHAATSERGMTKFLQGHAARAERISAG
jgi:hypothetical protein